LFTISSYRLEIFLFCLSPLSPFKIQVDKEGKIKDNRIKGVVIGGQGGGCPPRRGGCPPCPPCSFLRFFLNFEHLSIFKGIRGGVLSSKHRISVWD